MVNKSGDLGMDAAHTGGMKRQQMKRRQQRWGGGAGGYCAKKKKKKNNSGLQLTTLNSLFPLWTVTFLNAVFFITLLRSM